MFKLTPVTSKIGQGHPSSNLTKTLLRYIHGISLGPMRLIFVQVIVFTSENCKFSCLNWPRDLKNRSRSSIFELNQDTLEIHPWYKFGPNAINICRVIVFTSKMLMDRRTDGQTDRQTDRQTDGQTNLIVGLVTRNPPNNIICGAPVYVCELAIQVPTTN